MNENLHRLEAAKILSTMHFAGNMEAIEYIEGQQQSDIKSLRKSTSRNVLCGLPLEENVLPKLNTSVEFDKNNNPISKQSEPPRAKRARKRREIIDKENVDTMCTRILRSSKRLKKVKQYFFFWIL